MKIKSLFLSVLLLVIAGNLFAQKKETVDFEFLVNKIKNDYPGYQDKTKPELYALEEKLRDKINKYPDSSVCYFNQYVSFFKDGHLRIEHKTNAVSPVKKMTTSSFGRNFPIDMLSQNTECLTLEGIWTSLIGDIAIVKCPDRKDTLLGISINYKNWDNGFVVYEFMPVNDTLFNIKEHAKYENQKPVVRRGSLEMNRQILEIHDRNMFFTRKSDSKKYDDAFLATNLPKYPNGRNIYHMAMIINDSTFYMRIPSFAGTKDDITEMVVKYWEDIINRPNLIIDIRGNYGGQSDSYDALKPLLYTHPFEVKGVVWYASSGNIAHFEHSILQKDVRNADEGVKWMQALVDKMKSNVGGYVVHPYDYQEKMVSMDTMYNNPRNIGIIIDKTNASAAEQFLLYAKNSRKVILFGNESTAGILDYSNTTPNAFPSNEYELYCPMSKSLRLPKDAIDNIGIKPDVIIPFPANYNLYDRLDQWVYFVRNYVE